ncbi:nitrite reductase small subunit NirD [Amylibacter sp. SFDW26]|uniref:nitrite reductase small subunit NirD n=1 Tax=Amylibacter sp. SFDW26 TaxID=2652722 RepID=UPI001262076E|nr:nitrite reductase small subunit NirD [Amylibacter sp. SFDW26]KAB7610064.1 nitrite reductase small subunit NirD [Amylibacter sp. SFDW26]
MNDFVDIGAVEDIPVRAARVVKTPQGCIAVFRTATNKVYAIDDKCPHKGGPLSNGIQHDESITCPLHNWVFDLNTGQAKGADEGSVKTYTIKVTDGRILMDTSEFIPEMAAE